MLEVRLADQWGSRWNSDLSHQKGKWNDVAPIPKNVVLIAPVNV
jgi:hypothetical protein